MKWRQSAAVVCLGLTFGLMAENHAIAQFWNLGASQAVWGLSSDGSVASGISNNNTFFYWTPGGGVTNVGGVGSSGRAGMSQDGSRFSGSQLNPATNLVEMAYYEIGTGWTRLGGIGNPCSGVTSTGWGMGRNGQSVVGLGWLSCSEAHAIQWKQGGSTTDLGSTVPGRSSRANAANFDGSVVVGWQDAANGFRQGAVWNNGVQTILSGPSGVLSEAADVSNNGRWIVGSGTSSNGFNAWRWDNFIGTAAGYEDLGRPAGTNPAWRGASTAVNGDGSTIVGYYRPFPGPATLGRGFIWVNGSIVDLNAYVAGFGVNTGGVTLALPLAISADGTTIGGLGSGGVGFIVKIPEPGTATLVWFLFPALACFRRMLPESERKK